VAPQVLAAGNREHKDLEALLGKAACLEKTEQFAAALELLNQVVVGYPWFLPALVEKARLLLALDDWEQVRPAGAGHGRRVWSQGATLHHTTARGLLARRGQELMNTSRSTP
jgi:hypothetical protein